MSYLVWLLVVWSALLLGMLRLLQRVFHGGGRLTAKQRSVGTQTVDTQTQTETVCDSQKTMLNIGAIYVTPHGRCFHSDSCKHLQKSRKRYEPCKDCVLRLH